MRDSRAFCISPGARSCSDPFFNWALGGCDQHAFVERIYTTVNASSCNGGLEEVLDLVGEVKVHPRCLIIGWRGDGISLGAV